MKIGWISLHRKLQECDIWLDDEPFDRRSAWIDLLLSANHEDKGLIFDGHRIIVERGQLITSVRKLSAKWHWGKDKTLAYLRLLEELQMIERKADSRKTLLTIVNYDIYQNEDLNERTVNRQSTDSQQTVSRHRPATNNNVNNENNENKYICSFEDFWKIYPRKTDKGRAYQCYQARLKAGYSEDELLTACKNYAEQCKKNGTEQRYIKQGSTFLGINEPFRDYLKGEADGSVGRIFRVDEEQRNREIDETYRRIQSGEADHDDDGLWDMPRVGLGVDD